MKYIILLCFILLANRLQAQTDTIVRYWVYSEATQSAVFETDNAAYASTRAVYWFNGGFWKMESHFIANGKLYMAASYTDAKGTKKEGSFISYYPNGKVASKTNYKNGLEDGLYQKWYENGQPRDSFLMRNGIIVGKGYSWNEDGSIFSVYDLDQEGNGTVKTLRNKFVSPSDGNLLKGKKEGKWIYYADEGYKEWELTYQMDSVISFHCFDKSGNELKDCIFEKEAEAGGGPKAWVNYLQNAIAKYDYPSKKLSKSKATLSGEVHVKFLVNKDGSISEVNVAKSLNSEADMIARNVILSAPKWIAGIYKNKPVRSFHTQPFTFQVTDK
jgi:hypothetical protein